MSKEKDLIDFSSPRDLTRFFLCPCVSPAGAVREEPERTGVRRPAGGAVLQVRA